MSAPRDIRRRSRWRRAYASRSSAVGPSSHVLRRWRSRSAQASTSASDGWSNRGSEAIGGLASASTEIVAGFGRAGPVRRARHTILPIEGGALRAPRIRLPHRTARGRRQPSASGPVSAPAGSGGSRMAVMIRQAAATASRVISHATQVRTPTAASRPRRSATNARPSRSHLARGIVTVAIRTPGRGRQGHGVRAVVPRRVQDTSGIERACPIELTIRREYRSVRGVHDDERREAAGNIRSGSSPTTSTGAAPLDRAALPHPPQSRRCGSLRPDRSPRWATR